MGGSIELIGQSVQPNQWASGSVKDIVSKKSWRAVKHDTRHWSLTFNRCTHKHVHIHEPCTAFTEPLSLADLFLMLTSKALWKSTLMNSQPTCLWSLVGYANKEKNVLTTSFSLNLTSFFSLRSEDRLSEETGLSSRYYWAHKGAQKVFSWNIFNCILLIGNSANDLGIACSLHPAMVYIPIKLIPSYHKENDSPSHMFSVLWILAL